MKFPFVTRKTANAWVGKAHTKAYNDGYRAGRLGARISTDAEVIQARDMLAAAQAREDALREELKLANDTIHQLIATQQDEAFANYINNKG